MSIANAIQTKVSRHLGYSGNLSIRWRVGYWDSLPKTDSSNVWYRAEKIERHNQAYGVSTFTSPQT